MNRRTVCSCCSRRSSGRVGGAGTPTHGGTPRCRAPGRRTAGVTRSSARSTGRGPTNRGDSSPAVETDSAQLGEVARTGQRPGAEEEAPGHPDRAGPARPATWHLVHLLSRVEACTRLRRGAHRVRAFRATRSHDCPAGPRSHRPRGRLGGGAGLGGGGDGLPPGTARAPILRRGRRDRSGRLLRRSSMNGVEEVVELGPCCDLRGLPSTVARHIRRARRPTRRRSSRRREVANVNSWCRW